jgi:hypothetical protein
MRRYPPSKSVCQVRSNYWYEKCQTTFDSMKVCNCIDHCNGHRTYETPTSNETACRYPCNINLSVSSLPRLRKWSYAERALAFQISGTTCLIARVWPGWCFWKRYSYLFQEFLSRRPTKRWFGSPGKFRAGSKWLKLFQKHHLGQN